MRKKRDLFTIALQEVGLNPRDFVEQHIGGTYQGFRCRVRSGGLRLAEYHKILFFTGKKFEELFPNPMVNVPHKISLNIAAKTHTQEIKGIRQYVKKSSEEVEKNKSFLMIKSPRVDSNEEKKKEVQTVQIPTKSFKIIDPFEDGLPPVLGSLE